MRRDAVSGMTSTHRVVAVEGCEDPQAVQVELGKRAQQRAINFSLIGMTFCRGILLPFSALVALVPLSWKSYADIVGDSLLIAAL